MKHKLRILLVQGHRNSSGGNPKEIALTAPAARAIQHALQQAGHTADMLQDHNNWFTGSLDAVGREVVRRHKENPYDIMLDIHFEGDANNTRGVFAIVPDGDGLRTVTSYVGRDSIDTNTLDKQYAMAISTAVSESTGLMLRRSGVVEPGVMSERQTGVGGNGWRLAMFGYTAPVRQRMVRLVLELGNIQSDYSIISSPEFYQKVATGVVNGIGRVLGTGNIVHLPPAPLPGFGTITRLANPVLVQVGVHALNARKWAETDQPIMRLLKRGDSFRARGWIVGEAVEGNPIWWIMGSGAKSDLQWRVWSGGTNFSIAQILDLPTQEAA